LYKTISSGEEDQSSTNAGGGEDEAGPTTLIDAIQSLIGGDDAVGSVVEDQRTNSLIVTTTPSRFAQIDQMIARLDVRIPQILIEAEMLDISKNTADLLGAKFGSTPFQFQGAAKSGFYFPYDTDKISDDSLIYSPAINSFQGLTLAMEFLRTQTDTRSLARPRILTLNNETAEIRIRVNEVIGIESVEESESGNITVSGEREDTGVFLTVTPQANIDTHEITLAVEPRVIQAKTGKTFFFNGSSFTFIDPEERGAKAMLRVMDGDTVIIGGLLRNEIENIATKVPLLSKVPILGAGFRHKDKDETQRELIIFLTPHIIKETITANLEGRKDIPIVREQGIPNQALKEINKDLSRIENQRY
ncbi:MAG: hypothetical protein KC684_05295, partial [Candidatus Omnitrophica bacterium]|nr:hypothetical protein [Candidatus Omnitrophota bacterium]